MLISSLVAIEQGDIERRAMRRLLQRNSARLVQFEQSVKVASGKPTKFLELFSVDIGALDGRRHNERVEIDLKSCF